ncbi:MAG: hypothetical protein WCS69_04370 [Ignavibacteriaceae bacterium]|jgi:hypothetical protein
MKDISKIESEVRTYINAARKINVLLKDKIAWNKLCSSLDIIGDTELAIKEYLKIKKTKNDGEKYLIVFGILQILFVQQDAVNNLCEALNIKFPLNQDLIKIREIRNDSIGHPTKRGSGEGKYFNFISRPYLGHTGLSLMTVYPSREKETEFRHYNIHELIRTQNEIIYNSLIEVVKKLKEEEMEHRKKHRDKSIAGIFPTTLHYHFEKMYESTHQTAPLDIGKINYDVVKKNLGEFITELQNRGVYDAYDWLKYHIELIEYPLERLRNYFYRIDDVPNDKDAYIYIFFLEKQFKEIVQMAKEIDAEYQEDL